MKRVLVNQETGTYYAWQYEEAALNLAEYEEYEEMVAQIETPAMQVLQEKNDILMQALADIYEGMEDQKADNLAVMVALADIYEKQEGAV